MIRRILGTAALTAFACVSRADVRLHPLFTDHAVLQRGAQLPVWGWADHGEQVMVEFAGQKATTTAVNGRWKVVLAPLPGSDQPQTMKVTGKNVVEVNDLLVGEVWVASGQSNMEWPMHRTENPEAEIQASANPMLRLFTVPKRKMPVPAEDIKSAWTNSGPESVRGFSAVAYYFGKDLQASLKVPVGIIHTSWGGSPAEVWIREDLLKADKAFTRDILDTRAEGMRKWAKARATWEAERAAAQAEGKPFTKGAPSPGWQPSELYNGMIAPLLPFPIAGAIWYQGESNADRAWQYRSLFTTMIENWRHDWRSGPFPFLLVQLAPWDRNKKRSLEEITATPGDSAWAELREAQNYAAEVLDNVGVAVITDLGDKDDIHPTRKQPVGARLALLAREIAYGDKSVLAHGPTYQSVTFDGSKAIVTFDNVGAGLNFKGEKLTGFSIAGEDGRFHWAEARFEGRNAVALHSPEVAKPVAVRYGWADFPVVNLFNSAGLPTSPFRTDSWPATTLNKR